MWLKSALVIFDASKNENWHNELISFVEECEQEQDG